VSAVDDDRLNDRRIAMVTFIRRADVNGVDKQQKAVDWAESGSRCVGGRFGFSTVEGGVEVYSGVPDCSCPAPSWTP
jgi:hypothetical protein